MIARLSMRSLPILLLVGLLLQLAACDTDKVQETRRGMQQNHFLQSLRLIEGAGATLQQSGVGRPEIDSALERMDQGLQQAFQVEPDFLAELDARLPRVYSEWFIAGVEQYRLGVESSNRDMQIKGLDLLSRWGEFWGAEGEEVMQGLEAINE